MYCMAKKKTLQRVAGIAAAHTLHLYTECVYVVVGIVGLLEYGKSVCYMLFDCIFYGIFLVVW